VHDDQKALRDYTRGNLTSYWEPTLDKVATAVESLPDEQVLDEFTVADARESVAFGRTVIAAALEDADHRLR
jgi:hypothetical protein